MDYLNIWSIVFAAVAALLGYAIKWLLEKYSNKYIQAALEFLDQAIVTAVYAVNQVYVDEIKKARADGELTDEEKKHAFDLAWDYVKKQIPPLFMAALKKLFGGDAGVSSYVETKIEAVVKEAKQPF